MKTMQNKAIKGQDAKFILNSHAHKDAIAKLLENVDSRVLNCDPKDKDLAQILVITRQVVQDVIRAYEALVNDADFEIVLLEMNEYNKKAK